MKLLLLFLIPLSLQAAEPLNLSLPTDNRAIFDGKPEDFYMWVPRSFDGKSSKPWSAGQYGFVRTLVNTTNEGVIATKFHEGLDIKPIKRDKSFRPLDTVSTIAEGKVVYTSMSAGGSNYGKYVVVEHNWGYGPFFSLYAHLSEISVKKGQRLLGGSPLGKMGYTGAGISRERAHLHLELNLLTSSKFDDWHEEVYKGKNPHDLYNGMNLIGIDVASLFLAQKNNPDLTIPAFLSGATPYFKVTVNRDAPLEIVGRYPWLKKGDHETPSSSWEISFTDSGIPLSVVPSNRAVKKPTISYVRTTRSKHSYYTRKRLVGEGRRASLSKSGLNFIALFTNSHSK
ncbi:M23 family metallopeptidase [Akkermansiaceae bacterium]|nr:M23 family metallopeptidase [Akkermansiaceae bacterium]MDB4554423.1 M23 family metallopeptidase [Akkermansiaceae bacterium]MDC1206539.1 M23 family metallopeptidase [Akkermansiaceae bacterium]